MKTLSLPQFLLFTGVLFLGFCSLPNEAKAEWRALPPAEISAKTLGGEILLIQMKHSLIIDGEESARILSELGASMKKAFINEMIMGKPATALTENYGRPDRPATNAVIDKYISLTSITPPIT